jgi:carbamate kinase
MPRRVVVAIGGNAITRPHQVGTIPEQYANSEETCRHLLPLVRAGYELALTHGNGPQVGNILRRVELSSDQVYPLPLDVCVSDTQGGMGYMLQQVMSNVLRREGLTRQVITVLTQVEVDALDPALESPSKPIGPYFDADRASKLQRERSWPMVEEPGRGYRRVAPSPRPLRIIEIDVIREMVARGWIVIAAGGGGIPVVLEAGRLRGIEAVVDKDLASSLLATEIQADLFIIETNVERVFLNYGKAEQAPVERMNVSEAKGYYDEGHFPAGTMGPKIEAAISYLERGGGEVLITDVATIEKALRGETGTRVVPD